MSFYDDEMEDELDEDSEEDLKHRYLAISLENEKYVLPIIQIKEIVQLPQIVRLPKVSGNVHSVINLRGVMIPYYDMREILELQSVENEENALITLLENRKQDHIKWLNELINSIHEKRKFGLTTDPHACAFGKWYDNFHTEDNMLTLFLRKFDTPHKKIHSLAIHAEEIIRKEGYQAALDFIEHEKSTTLQEMIDLFNSAPNYIKGSHKQLVIVFEFDNELRALSADQVLDLMDITPDMIQTNNIQRKSEFIVGGTTIKDNAYLVLDPYLLYQSA